MSVKKKLFLNYADSDIVMHNNLSLHLSVLKDKIDPWSKGQFIGGDEKNELLQKNFKNADAVIHLLSIHFENESQCVELLQNSVRENKKNIPILISSFDWESDTTLLRLKDELLPEDRNPVDVCENLHKTLTDIVKKIRSEVLGEKSGKETTSSRSFYYILSAVVFLIGCLATFWVYNMLQDASLAIITFLMVLCIILLVLRKVIFPTNISALK